MSLAETAHLAVQMDLTGNFSQAIRAAEADTKAFAASAASGAATGLSKLEKGLGGVGNALGHAKSQIGGLLTGPLGILGLGAGLFTLGGAIDQGINKAADLGLEVQKLTALTGGSAESMSALAGAFEHFNLSSATTIKAVGMLEKNVGLLAAKKDGLAAFQKTFGLALTDSNGHVKDANALILTAADYFNNKLIPATTKAAALSKLFGRAWVDLIPLLSAGSKGIKDAEAAAADLGLTLTKSNINDLAKFKESTRELGTAIGGLELQIGLALVPAIRGLADAATKFIHDNRAGIVQFFKDAASNAQKFGAFIANDVIPPLKSIASAAKAAWDAIPEPIKQLLVGTFVANKVIKWTFGVDVVGDIGSALAKGLAGSFLQRGGTPANPLFVSDVSGGLGGLGGAAEGAAAGGVGATLLTVGLTAGTIAAIGVAFISAMQMPDSRTNKSPGQAFAPGHGFGPAQVGSDLAASQGRTAGPTSPEDRQAHSDAMAELSRLQSVKDSSQTTASELKKLQAASAAANAKKIADLSKLQGVKDAAQGTAKEITKAAAKAHADALAMLNKQIAANQKLADIKDKSQSITLKVSTTVTAGSVAKTTTRIARYGPAVAT